MRILNFIGKGIYHQDKGMPCQDSLLSSYENGRAVLALSDGCGSSSFSHIASDIIVRAVKDFFGGRELSADSETKGGLIEFINHRLREKAEELSLRDMQELLATLIFAVQEGDRLLVGQIGDGALMCFDEEGRCVYFSAPENSGAKNRTYFINSASAYDKLRMELTDCAGIRNIILFTDGPQRFFENQINTNLKAAVSEIVGKVRSQEIATEAQLKNYIHEIFGENIYDVYDDWSLIVTDSAYGQNEKSSCEPENMALYFYELYLKNTPDSKDYVLPIINRIREELSLEPMILSVTEESADTEPENSVITAALFNVAEQEKEDSEKEEGKFYSYFSDTEIVTSFDCSEGNRKEKSDDEDNVFLQEEDDRYGTDSYEEENVYDKTKKAVVSYIRKSIGAVKRFLSEKQEEQ